MYLRIYRWCYVGPHFKQCLGIFHPLDISLRPFEGNNRQNRVNKVSANFSHSLKTPITFRAKTWGVNVRFNIVSMTVTELTRSFSWLQSNLPGVLTKISSRQSGSHGQLELQRLHPPIFKQRHPGVAHWNTRKQPSFRRRHFNKLNNVLTNILIKLH